jgi:hypothetical protein
MTIMLRANNVNVRCLALLYLRTFASPEIVYGCICNSFKIRKIKIIWKIKGEESWKIKKKKGIALGINSLV